MNNTRPKIAITDDTKLMRCRLLVKLIKMAGGEPIIIPAKLGKIKDIPTNCKSIAKLSDAQHKHLENAKKSHLDNVEKFLSSCDGIVLPGNKYDVPPEAYNAPYVHSETKRRLPQTFRYVRYETEKLMIEYGYENKLPMLGICGGFQTANVVFGGKLTQHIPDIVEHDLHRDNNISNLSKEANQKFEKEFEDFILHKNGTQIFGASHDFKILPNNIIADLYDNKNLDNIGELNLHHQGMFDDGLSDKMQAVAYADDGVIEAAILKNYPFGVFFQPHIECDVGGIALKSIQRLIEHC